MEEIKANLADRGAKERKIKIAYGLEKYGPMPAWDDAMKLVANGTLTSDELIDRWPNIMGQKPSSKA